MTRRSAILLLAAGSLLLGRAGPARAQLTLLAPVLPSPTDVVKVIDHLTKKDSDTSVDIKLGKTTRQGKLLVSRTTVDVALERTSKNWRGQFIVQMTVPTEVSYSIDMTEITADRIRLDEKNRLLVVAMPRPQVEAVTPELSRVSIRNEYKSLRSKRFDVPTSRELQNSMLREDYQSKARKTAEKQLTQARDQGRKTLELFLQRVLGASFPGVRVVVE